jgi:hypothetical protein
MSEERDIKEVGSRSLSDSIKNLATSKRKGLVIGLIIALAVSPILISIIVQWYVSGGNPFAPTVGNEADYIGYAKIQLREYNPLTGEYSNFTGKGAFIDNNDTTQVIDSDVDFDGVTVYHMTKVTLVYLYLVNGASKTYINQTFLVLANANINNPAINVVNLYVKTTTGDLDAHIYDLNGTRGEYHPSDLGIAQNFTLAINSLNFTKPMGMNQFIPEPYQYDTRFGNTGLWLAMDSKVVDYSLNYGNGSWIYDTTLGISYLLLPSNLHGDNQEHHISLTFESVPPTYFKYYDGIPTSTDLLLTDNT